MLRMCYYCDVSARNEALGGEDLTRVYVNLAIMCKCIGVWPVADERIRGKCDILEALIGNFTRKKVQEIVNL